jgi:hypothetical protein
LGPWGRKGNRDFDEEMIHLYQRLRYYEFLNQTLPFDSATALFPPAAIENRVGVEVFVPNVPFYEKRVSVWRLTTLSWVSLLADNLCGIGRSGMSDAAGFAANLRGEKRHRRLLGFDAA